MTARILVADDVDANVKILEAKLKAAYYEVLTASNGVEALERTRADQPDLVLLDVMMPRMDGFECCSLLKADPETTRIPIVMVTALDQHADRLRGLEAGADDFLTKPPHDAALAARVRSLVRTKLRLEELRERERALSGLSDEPIIDLTAVRPEGRVILVEGREARARAMADALTATLPVDCVTAGDRGAALAAAAEAPPSLFVVSNRLGGDDGLRLCSELRSRPESRQAAILVIVDDGDFESAASSLDLGADDYVMRPVDTHELVARARTQLRRARYMARLRAGAEAGLRMALTDGLTGLYNRRYADRALAGLLEQRRASGEALSVMLLDLDRFKQVNDQHGHPVGDAVLIEFARRVQAQVRGADVLARFGGEEFVIVAPETELAEAAQVAERVRAGVADAPFAPPGGPSLSITVSVGVAEAGAEESAAELLQRADLALYASKKSGRDRVTTASPVPASAIA